MIGEIKCNVSSTLCFNILTDIHYRKEIDGKTHLIGKCKLHGERHLPFVPYLNIPTEKTKKLKQKEAHDNQPNLL